ncbi:XRE family transcriptional regulator [Baekduia soli]|uniref:XRE family transcriptional regulator n=1 Tax=Baekduia soli TaxID=496014 RepID=UPI002AA2A78F|nr:ImmA/IrrE family metallo-endopeptidase [Baekduia soli]
MNVTRERLDGWESGEASPTVAQLRNLAKAYKRPLAVFFLPEPPSGFMPLHDYRRLPGTIGEGWSPALRLALRRAEGQQQAASELRSLLGEEPPALPVVNADATDAERFAAEARGVLGVTLAQQFSWRDRYKALAGWTAALEEAGVLVLQTSGIAVDEMRGFSISDPVVPVIVLNGSDAPRGRIFTALHEWVHLLLNEAGVCDLHDQGDGQDDETERFCNETAAAILMPADTFGQEAAVRAAHGDVEVPDSIIGELATRYSVSQESVVRRLLSLGVGSWDFYMHKRAEYHEAYMQQRADEEGFAPFHRVRVRDLGKAYVRLVLDAYHGDRINVSEVSDYLGIRLKHLPKIEREALTR